MKKSILIYALAFFLFSCGGVENSQEYKDLQAKNDSLAAAAASDEKNLEEYTQMMNEIEANLDSVAKDQLAVAELNKEGYQNQKEKIDAMISAIDSYMETNNRKLAELERKSKKSSGKNKALQKMISTLKKTLADKEAEIVTMRSTIAGLETKVEELSATVTEKESVIAQKESELTAKDNDLVEKQKTIDAKESELSTGYYVYGTKKELVEMGLIKKEGGVLGMGKTAKISDRLDNSKFKKINTKTLSEIKLGIAKKKKLITTHPGDAYFFSSSGSEIVLKISDPAKFWSLSKYCIVEID